MWQDRHDAQMRANYTVVRYEGVPVFISGIRSIDEELWAEFNYLLSGRNGNAKLTDESWDWSPVPTGFVNVNKRVFYVQRKPCRKYKHGLSKDNCAITPGRLGMMDIFKSKQFGKTVMRDYPAYEKIMREIQPGEQGAFHPDFALSKRKVGPVFLEYRTDTVGWYEKDELILGEGWDFLKELVAEVTNANA